MITPGGPKKRRLSLDFETRQSTDIQTESALLSDGQNTSRGISYSSPKETQAARQGSILEGSSETRNKNANHNSRITITSDRADQDTIMKVMSISFQSKAKVEFQRRDLDR